MVTTVESQGSQLQRGDGGSPETFTLVGQITSIGGPSGSASEIDVSTLDSTAREFQLGLADEGDITLELVYDPANTQQEGLRSDRTARTQRNFQIILPDVGSTTFSFAAFVREFSLDASVDEVWRATATLRITGAVTKS